MPPFRSTVRVIAGTHRGRIIPLTKKDFREADITPQKVKGAVFSMIGEWLDGKRFLDLYAGSGQIGIEALSRGAEEAVFVERDPGRCRCIASCLERMGLAGRGRVMPMAAEEAVVSLGAARASFDFLYLDPPYAKRGGSGVYENILLAVEEAGILAQGGVVIVQHWSKTVIGELIGDLTRMRTRPFGTTSVTLFSHMRSYSRQGPVFLPD